MAVDENNHVKRSIRCNILKIVKAIVKAAIIVVVYLILMRVLSPVSIVAPSFQQILETFVIVYVTLMIVGELTSGTLFQHIFNFSKSTFVVMYLIVTLNSGIFEYTYGPVSLLIDLRVFLIITMLLGLLGMARSIMQAINYVSEKSESQGLLFPPHARRH